MTPHHCDWEAIVEEQGFELVGLRCELVDVRDEVVRLRKQLAEAQATIRAFVMPVTA